MAAKKRGRKSKSALAIVPSKVERIPRAPAPKDLSDEEKFEWVAVVNRMAADHFPRETHGVLAQYCRHIVAARCISQWIQDGIESKAMTIDRYDQLLKMQEREGRALSSLATRMRLTQQSRYDASKKKPDQGSMPWE